MRVQYDDQIFTVQRRGGISRYFTELFREFDADPGLGVEVVAPYRFVVNDYVRDLYPGRYGTPPLPAYFQRGRVIRGLNRLTGPRRVEADILHHTHYFPDALSRPARIRVTTVYDMIPEMLPEYFPTGTSHAAKADFVSAADAVLCISESTKRDVLAHYGALDKPVVVTPLGVRPEFFTPGEPAPGEPYVLFIGERDGYKNFDVLLRAFALVAAAHPRLRLRCVGGPPPTNDEQTQVHELGLASRIDRLAVSDADLPAVYAGAEVFVFPSRYEGFGLPIVEAFAAGCPVALCDMPCSHEVGGHAAQYVAFDDAERLAEIIAQLVAEQGVRAHWIALGRVRAATFTWQRTARLTAGVYRELAAAHS